MSKPKKRDPQPLYVPKGKTRDTITPSGDDLVDGISDLSLKPVKPKKTTKSNLNGKVVPEAEVPDSWESISENDVGNVSVINIIIMN